MYNAYGLLALGVVSGAFAGLVGVGGGIVIVPALVFLFGMPQHMAQGTSLALLLPPIGAIAAYTYWQKGYVDVRVALLIIAGFLLGSYFGSKFAVSIPRVALQRVFGVFLLFVAGKMILAK
jgi:uncharacterized membrane protein YfcA